MRLGIIIGVSKAGTTSVFEYLKVHPHCCGAVVKQTNFFLDADMVKSGLVAIKPYDDRTDAYLELFKDYKQGQVLVEASPDYILSPGTPSRIAAYCRQYGHEPYLILLLRHPISRLVSWFHYGRKQGSVSMDEDFDTFIAKSQKDYDLRPEHMPYLAMKTGMYMPLIRRVLAHHPPERLLVLNYEDLVAHPESVMSKIAVFLGIDPNFYNAFQFEVHNKTTGVRSTAMARLRKRMRRVLLPLMHRHLAVKTIMRPVVSLGKTLYDVVNTTHVGHEGLTEEQTKMLEQYYAADQKELSDMFQFDFNR